MSNITREIPTKDIYDDHDFRVEVISDDITSTDRWSEIHSIVFKYDGKHYRTWYSQGLTEYQDERPFEINGDTIQATEVEQVEKVVKVWEPVPAVDPKYIDDLQEAGLISAKTAIEAKTGIRLPENPFA